MILTNTDSITVLIAITYILSLLTLGILIEKFFIKILLSLVSKTKWRYDDIIVESVDKLIVLWFFLLGIYLAERELGLGEDYKEIYDNAVLIILVFTVSLFIARLISNSFRTVNVEGSSRLPSASIFGNFVRLIVFTIAFLIILDIFGVSITPMLTALGVGGLAVALSLQETLSNFFSGLQVVASRKVRPKQYIQLDTGEEGYVEDITWRYTTIRNLPGNIIVIPNSKLASAAVTNYYLPSKDMAVLINIGVSYDSDLEKVEKITNEVGKEIMEKIIGGVPDFDPFIRYNQFGDFSINFTVILRCSEFVDQYIVKHEFIKALHKAYKANKITIPYPIRTVEIKK